MELLETQDPEKKKLIETSERHKRELEKEVHEMSDKTERMVKNALIIGGTLAVVYLVVSQLNPSKKKSRKAKANSKPQTETELDDDDDDSSPSQPSFLSQVGERITAQAAAMLMEMAREKLADYLSKRKQ